MTAATHHDERTGTLNPLLWFLVFVLGIAVAVAVLALGTNALLGVVGVILFVFFLRKPILGLYVTTAALLLAGVLAGAGVLPYGVPSAAAKAAGGATIAAWILNTLTTGKRFHFSREVLVTFAFVAWALLGISYSMTWRMQMSEWTRLLTVAVYFVLAIHLLNSREKLHTFVVLLLACGAIMSAYAIAQYFVPALQAAGETGIQSISEGADVAFIDPEGTATGAAVRVTGGTGHSNWLAFSLLLLLPLNIYWYSTMKRTRGKVLVLLTVLVELSALVLTFTRLSLAVGLVIAFVLLARRMVHLNAYRVSALAVALIVAWFVLPTAYKERVIDITKYSTSESSASRLELQSYAWQYMQEFPIVGTGLGGFGLRFYEENSPAAAMLRWMHDELGFNPLYYGPHNMYLQLGSETGTVGLLLLVLLSVFVLLDAQRARNILRAIGDTQLASLAESVTVSILAFLFCSVFLHGLQQKIWWMVFAVAASCLICALRLQQEHEEQTKAREPQTP
ncbi:MAG: O-antigen ligase family protein [Candidatus Hydrogenedentes bacterium]|nr:O-antigen ligase family protein [Candidatus Hydrogenedentota bacterium]